jgi:hypothetical protein
MGSLVTFVENAGIGVITLKNPPLDLLSRELMKDLATAIDAATRSTSRAVVLRAGGSVGLDRARLSAGCWAQLDWGRPPGTPACCKECGCSAADNCVALVVFECQRGLHRAPADEHVARNILSAAIALQALAA